MEVNEILVQIIGFIGYGLIGASYLAKRKEKILIWSLVGGLVVALHLYLLGGLTGALCNVIGGGALIAIYIYDKYGKTNKIPLIILVTIISAIIAWLSWAGPESLLPIFASTVILVAFVFSKEQYIRIANIIGGALWLIYGIVMGSAATIICEVFIILMTAIALWKYRGVKSKELGKGAKGNKEKMSRGNSKRQVKKNNVGRTTRKK